MSPRDWHFVPIIRCANIRNVGLTNKRPGHRLGFAVQAVTVPFSSLEPGSLKWILFILHWPGENCTWLFMNWVSQQDSARQPGWGWSACVKLPGQNWSQAVTHNVWPSSLRTGSLQGQKHAKWGREDFCSFSLSY